MHLVHIINIIMSLLKALRTFRMALYKVLIALVLFLHVNSDCYILINAPVKEWQHAPFNLESA